MPNDACWSCGAKGACFERCGCRRCTNPLDYQRWKRNQPGDWRSKAEFDRANRLELERSGQITMRQKIQEADAKFVSLREKWRLIVIRLPDVVTSARDSWSLLKALLEAFSTLSADVIAFAKG